MGTIKLRNAIFVSTGDQGFVPALRRLVKQPIKGTQAFALAKFVKQVEEKGRFFAEAKESLFRKYGDENEETKEIKVREIEKDHFIGELEELINIQEEYELEKLSLELDKIELTTDDAVALQPLFE